MWQGVGKWVREANTRDVSRLPVSGRWCKAHLRVVSSEGKELVNLTTCVIG